MTTTPPLLTSTLTRWLRATLPLLQLALPPSCGLCHTLTDQPHALCPNCWHSLTFLARPWCECCGRPFEQSYEQGFSTPQLCVHCLADPPPYQSARAALAYNESASRLLSRFKYTDQTHLAQTFAPWLIRASSEIIEGVEAIVPIPLHRRRLFMRLYNQAALLGKTLADYHTLPLLTQALTRPRSVHRQVGLRGEERRRNVRAVFKANPEIVKDKTLLLIDDVMTTGATLESATETLLSAGAKAVRVVTLARVLRPEDWLK